MSSIARTTASTAIASLQGLKAGLSNVRNSMPVAGGMSLLRLGTDGVWVYGQENVDVEPGSLWVADPRSLMHGWASWTDHPGKQKNELVGEVMVTMTEPLPDRNSLKDTGWDWSQQLSIHMACASGEDEGTQVLYKTTSIGGTAVLRELVDKVMKQLDVDPSKPVPVLLLESDHYPHKKYGKTYTPVFDIKNWLAFDAVKIEDEADDDQGGQTEPQAPEPAQPEPSRRRAAAAEPAAAEPSTRRRTSVPETPREPEPAQPASDMGGDAPIRRRRR